MTIFVSHRLSSATVADKIIVLKDGEVVELGNHRELMANEGEYYTSLTTQQSICDNRQRRNTAHRQRQSSNRVDRNNGKIGNN